MKLEIDKVLNPQASGPARASIHLVVEKDGGPPVAMALVMLADGQTVRATLTAAEAVLFGQMAVTCGCLIQGGMPPAVLATPSPAPSPIILGGNGRH